MTFKRRPSLSPSSQQTNNDTVVTQLNNSSRSNTCRICGDIARFINYGALSCQSCKTFFRRNGFRPESVRPCVANKFCEVNMLTRQNCTACRLSKCFQMGMTADLIRKEDRKKLKDSLTTNSNNTEQTTSRQLTILPKLIFDILPGEQSLSTNLEWTLLSNIIHAYDKYSTVSQVCQIINNLSTLPVQMYFDKINPLEIVSQMYISIQSFIYSLPDFRILTRNEQISLFERNLLGIIGFYSILFFRDTGILHNIKLMEAFETIYGSTIMLSAKNVNERLDSDSTLTKIILIIFAFSSNCLILNKHTNMKRDDLLSGTFRLFGSQNAYVELLWKYMIHRYSYYESALRFFRLIQIFLCVLKNLAIVQMNNEAHQNMVDSIIEKTRPCLSINDNEPTPLWGKT